MSNRKCVRLRIEGLVQGVGYRAWVEVTARGLGLDGFVRNRRDGGVEVLVRGDEERLADLIAECRKGPFGSRVDMIKVLDDDADVARGFVIAPTV